MNRWELSAERERIHADIVARAIERIGRCTPEQPCAELNASHLLLWGECYHEKESK